MFRWPVSVNNTSYFSKKIQSNNTFSDEFTVNDVLLSKCDDDDAMVLS